MKVLLAIFILVLTSSGFARGQSAAADNEKIEAASCPSQSESFALREHDLEVLRTENAVLFTAGMTIDADGAPNAYGPRNRGLDYSANAHGGPGQPWAAVVTDQRGNPVIQKTGRFRGYYVSTTSLQQGGIDDPRNPRKYIDATRIPYIALPPDFAATYYINLGDLAVVINNANGRSAYAIFADVGPKGRIGEGSIALAKQLGMPADPRRDSVADGVTYLIFPGSAASPGSRITAQKNRLSAARLYRTWGGRERLRVCQLLREVAAAP
jgi:hypothetical protein